MSHALRQGLGGGLRGLRIAGGAVRNLNGEPTKMSAVMYTYVDGMMDKRSPYRSDHLALLTAMTEEGTCLLGGAFAEPCDGAVLLFSDSEQAQTFVDKDPYNTGGLVTSYQIRDYMGVVGTLLKKGASGGGAGEGGGEGSSIPAPDQQASYKSGRL